MKIHNTIAIFSILSTLSVFVGISLLMTVVFAQQGELGTNIDSPQFLAIQHAQSGTIADINSTSYTLQLNDLADKTILFSDRPNRIVATETTQNFVGNWTSGKDSFQLDPPNAAIVALTDDQEDDVFVIELFNPIYDKDENAIRYDFSVLGNATSSHDLPANLGKSVLIIDSSESKWPLEYSGD
jgi:hypothetical protein